jgi:hypothetical protein
MTDLKRNLQILRNDIEFGLSSEKKLIKTLGNQFGADIQKTTNKYCNYDFFTANHKIELKTRRCNFRTYPTTIIPVKKTLQDGNLTFVFCFADKLCYIEYDKEKFSKYRIEDIEYVSAFGQITNVPHIHIPIEDLVEIEMTLKEKERNMGYNNAKIKK